MAKTFTFELVSPERVLLSAEADEVVIPGMEGDFTIYAGHAPVVSTLRPGVLDVTTQGTKRRIFVKSGFVEVNATSATVLADRAFDLSEFDASRLADELRAAEAELETAETDEDRFMAASAVDGLKAIGARLT